ncbi:M48 family metallopeptidase [Deinococcus radiomollis]|uniref:M48 family metallopeptidase n=1 Tax=Deinococcus radiomollis TaxID=468916 RepID=UPI0038916D81
MSFKPIRRRWQNLQTRNAGILRDVFVVQVTSSRPTFRYWLAQIMAVGIFIGYLWLGVWSVWAFWRSVHPLHFGYMFVAPLALGIFILAFPRIQKLPKDSLTETQAPEFHRLLAAIAAHLHISDPVRVTIDANFNAFMAQAGLPPRHWMNIGMPMLLSLAPQEGVFVMAHEMAHAVNGDPKRGFFASQALRFLYHMGNTWRPHALFAQGVGIMDIVTLPFTLAMLGFSWFFIALAWLLLQLSGEASQRAEYHADLLAASVSGSAAALTALDKLHLTELYDHAIHKHRHMPEHAHSFAELAHQMQEVSAERWANLRAEQEQSSLSLDSSHPPTLNRLAVIAAHPTEAKVLLDCAWAERIKIELTPLIAPLQKQAFEEYGQRIGLLY